MDYAVVKLAGTQYLVSPGDIIEVSKLSLDEGAETKIEDVLIYKTKDKAQIGTPKVTGAVVKAKILANFQGPKLDIFKFTAKSRYRRKMGFRPQMTRLEVLPFKV